MPADRRSHAFAIGGLEVQPFPVPHDAREPVQYAFSDGEHRLGVLTDSGSITPHIVEVLGACDGLVLECNHDQALLAASRYPARLKQRIGGRFGHLENDQAAPLLRQVDTRRLQHLVAAHLSQENNRPQLAARALASALGCSEDWIGVADQEGGFGWRQLSLKHKKKPACAGFLLASWTTITSSLRPWLRRQRPWRHQHRPAASLALSRQQRRPAWRLPWRHRQPSQRPGSRHPASAAAGSAAGAAAGAAAAGGAAGAAAGLASSFLPQAVTARAISAATRREFFMMGFLIDNRMITTSQEAKWLTG
jgi:hypothetical protein